MTTSEAAAVPGILNLGFYIFTFASGRLPAKIGYRNVVVAGVLGASAMFMLASVLDAPPQLYAAVFLAGVFLSFHLPSAIPWLGTVFKGGRQGFYIGVHESAAPAGQTLGPILLALLFTSIGVTASFTTWALIPLTTGVVILIFFKTQPTFAGTVDGGSKAKVLETSFVALTLVTIANLVGNLGVVAIVPLHLVDTFQLDKTFVATIVGVSRFLGVFGQPVGGYLHDKYGFYKIAAVLTATNFISNLYLMLASYDWLYPVIMTIQAFCTAMYFPLIYSYLVKTLGSNASPALGKMFSVSGLVGPTTAPLVAGVLAERYGYTVALLYPTVLALLGTAAIFTLIVKRKNSAT